MLISSHRSDNSSDMWMKWQHTDAEKRSCTQNNFSHAIVAWWPGLTITNDHGYVPFVVITIRFFPHSWRTTGFLTRVTRRVSRGQKELPTLSYSVFRDVRVVQSFVLWIVFYRSLFVLLSFYIGHCTVWPSSMYSFSFPL